MNYVTVEFKEALHAMQVGDPPLRWTVDNDKHAHTMRAYVSRSGCYRTFLHDGQLWVVRVSY